MIWCWSEILPLLKAQVADGALDRIKKHGAWEKVNDRVQSAVEVGEANAHHKELGEQIVAR